MAASGARRPRRPTRGGVIAALDVGTSKVCCLIARVEDAGTARVTGFGLHSSSGLRAGAIVDMEAALAAIGNAVHDAEQSGDGVPIRDVVVNVSGGHPTSQTVDVEVSISGHEVADADLRRALAQSRNLRLAGDAELIHSIPVGFSIDGNRGIRDPRGMMGDKLGVQMHLVTAASGPVRNLATCLAHCHLNVESYVVSPYASGLASLVDDERDLGVTVIDMGGGTTSIAVFFDGNVVFTDSLPVGGGHVTNDIARGLTTPVAHAERMKILYGNAMTSVTDERETIQVPQVGEDEETDVNTVPKSLLVGIIQPRLEEIFELVRSRLEAGGFAKLAGRRVVLTGGASQLPGTRELAQLVLDKQVRMGKPVRLAGLPDVASGPAFSTAAGLLAYAIQHQAEMPPPPGDRPPPDGLLGRLGQWLRDNL